MEKIIFNRNLEQDGNTQMVFVFGEAKEIVLDFSKGTAKVL